MDVEMKLLISAEYSAKIAKGIPEGVDDKKREVWFFETPHLTLKRQEVILRTRVNRKKKKVDSTAKWRRWVSPFATVRDAWQRLPGFKAEMDASLTESVPAWSVTQEEIEEDLFRSVADEKTRVSELFNKHQRQLVESGWPLLPWNEVKVWGPIESVQWKLPENITIERWTVGADSIIEISKRGEHQEVILGEIRDWLRRYEINGKALEGGKTAWALTRLIK